MARVCLDTSSDSPTRTRWRRLLWSTTRLGLHPLKAASRDSTLPQQRPPSQQPPAVHSLPARRQPPSSPVGPRRPMSPPSGPKVHIPHNQCWQCGKVGRDHSWNECTHPCLNCGGPSHHTPGGHKTSKCRAPTKGPHNKGFWNTDPPSGTPNHRQLPLLSDPPVSTPLVVA